MLLERDSELETVADSLAEAAQGRGSAVLVEGVAGIGKTALLDACRVLGSERGLSVLTARATPIEEDVAYGVARQLLLPAVLERDPDALFAGAAALARPALFGEMPEGPPSPDTAFAARHGLTWLVAELTEAVGPIAVFVDDLHWADAPSIGFLEALAGRAPELSLAMLLAARPAETWTDSELAAGVRAVATTVAPQRLSEDAVAEMLAEALPGDPDPGLAATVHEQTRGTPYLVEAVIGAVRRDSAAAADPERRESLGSAAVERDVAIRLRGLPDDARDLAQAVAVLGDERQTSEIETVAGLDTGPAGEAAELLDAAGILSGWPRPAFEHALVRAGVLSELDAAERARFHARAADVAIEAGDPERAASHLAEVPGEGDGRRAATLAEVGSRALAVGAAPIALRHLERAIAEPPPDPAVPGVLFMLGGAEMMLGKPSAIERFRAAGDRATDPNLRLQALMAGGWEMSMRGQWHESFDLMDEAISGAEGADPALIYRSRTELAGAMLTCFATGREASRRLAELDAEVPADSPARGMLEGVLGLRDARAGVPREEALARISAAAAAGPLDPTVSPVLGAPLIGVIYLDDFAFASELQLAVIENTRRRGNVTSTHALYGWRGVALWRQGRLDEALEAAVGMEEIGLPTPPMASLLALIAQAGVALDRGDVAGAKRLATPDRELAPGVSDTAMRDELLAVRARIALADGDAGTALRIATEVGERQTNWGAESPPVTQWRMIAALATATLGDAGDALELIDAELAAARRLGSPRPLSSALRAKAEIDPDSAEASLAEALDLLEGEPLDLERSRVLVALGEVREDGREMLREGLDLAWRVGADGLAERARASLLAAGGRPRRAELTGIRALTASEGRTARMAAEGLTNREIAQAQFVTEKTVETHLTSSYRKLGIAGRPQLAAALGDEA